MNLNLHDEDDEDNILTEYEKSFLIKAQESIVWKQNFTRIYKVLKEENNITIVLIERLQSYKLCRLFYFT